MESSTILTLFFGQNGAETIKFHEQILHKVRSAFADVYPEVPVSTLQISTALANSYSNGDPEKAATLLILVEKAVEGQLVPVSHPVDPSASGANPARAYYPLMGADNYHGVSCYVDTLLFSMFARLDNFEPILYDYEDDDSTLGELSGPGGEAELDKRLQEEATNSLAKVSLSSSPTPARSPPASSPRSASPARAPDSSAPASSDAESAVSSPPVEFPKLRENSFGNSSANAEHERERLRKAAASRRKVALCLRLYVNLIRSGIFITNDITAVLMDALFEAGWKDGKGKFSQQDCGELFNFITELLRMPLLTLKMDIQHGGKSVVSDDHKLVKERLLHVPIPGKTGDDPILLEECLEQYFANSVSVRRQIERRMTLDSQESNPVKQRLSVSVKSVDLPNRPRLDSIPHSLFDSKPQQVFVETVSSSDDEDEKDDNELGVVEEMDTESTHTADSSSQRPSVARQLSSANRLLWNKKNEFSLPAWMFLQLLPFYTDSVDLTDTPPSSLPSSGTSQLPDIAAIQQGQRAPGFATPPSSQAAGFFASARPVIGINLKRYEWTASGHPIRNDRQVTIPQTIYLPSFVADDDSSSKAPFGNFMLVLESAIFHRGQSIQGGHFVCAIAEKASNGVEPKPLSIMPKVIKKRAMFRSLSKRTKEIKKDRRHHFHSVSSGSPPPATPRDDVPRRWMFFDDLETHDNKVKTVDFNTIFNKEVPYLLFYRMVAIDADGKEKIEVSPRLSTTVSGVSSVESFKMQAPLMEAGSSTETLAVPPTVVAKAHVGTAGSATPGITTVSTGGSGSANTAAASTASAAPVSVPVVSASRPSSRGPAASPEEHLGHRWKRKRKEYRDEKCSIM